MHPSCSPLVDQSTHNHSTCIEGLTLGGEEAAAASGTKASAFVTMLSPLLCLRFFFSGRSSGDAARWDAADAGCAACSSAAWLRLGGLPPCSGCGDGPRSLGSGCATRDID